MKIGQCEKVAGARVLVYPLVDMFTISRHELECILYLLGIT